MKTYLALMMCFAMMMYLAINDKFYLPFKIILTLSKYYLKMLQYWLICLFIFMPSFALYTINIPYLVQIYFVEVKTKTKGDKEGHEAPMVEVKNLDVTKNIQDA